MSLREQFEAWWNTERMATAFYSHKQVAEEAFQAGHAVNANLLEACEVLLQFSRTEANCDTVAILHPSTSVDWHRGHRAALHLVRDKLEAAIKKTRGE